MSEEFARPNTEAKIHDLEQFVLWAPSKVENRRCQLRFGERNGAPRVTAFIPKEGKGSNIVPIGMSAWVARDWIDDFERLILKGGECQAKIVNNEKDQNAEQPFSKSFDDVIKKKKNTLLYGRLPDGTVYIAVEQGEFQQVFRFVPSNWHVFIREDGHEVTGAELSTRFALAFIRSFRDAVVRWTARLSAPFEPQQPKATTQTADAFSGVGSTFDL